MFLLQFLCSVNGRKNDCSASWVQYDTNHVLFIQWFLKMSFSQYHGLFDVTTGVGGME